MEIFYAMILSMTGYATYRSSHKLCSVKIELKTINSKYCDVYIKIPKLFSSIEIDLRSIIQNRLIRGKIDASIEIDMYKPLEVPYINKNNLNTALMVIEEIKNISNIDIEPTLDNILRINNVIEYKLEPEINIICEEIKIALSCCIDKLNTMRAAEGKNLETHINDLAISLNQNIALIEECKDTIFAYWLDKLKNRLQELKIGIDEERIIQESAIFAEKADIDEEIHRVKSHLQQLDFIIKNEFPCGKKLDFLCQELNREYNTMASKSAKTDILNKVIDAKAIIDSIREQVQNIL